MHLTVTYIFYHIITTTTTTIAAYSFFCVCVFFFSSILPLYALSSAREKDDWFVFNTTTDGSVSLRSTPSWKSEREYCRKYKKKKKTGPRLLVPQLPLIPGVKLRKFSICLRAKRAIIISKPMQTHKKTLNQSHLY